MVQLCCIETEYCLHCNLGCLHRHELYMCLRESRQRIASWSLRYIFAFIEIGKDTPCSASLWSDSTASGVHTQPVAEVPQKFSSSMLMHATVGQATALTDAKEISSSFTSAWKFPRLAIESVIVVPHCRRLQYLQHFPEM